MSLLYPDLPDEFETDSGNFGVLNKYLPEDTAVIPTPDVSSRRKVTSPPRAHQYSASSRSRSRLPSHVPALPGSAFLSIYQPRNTTLPRASADFQLYTSSVSPKRASTTPSYMRPLGRSSSQPPQHQIHPNAQASLTQVRPPTHRSSTLQSPAQAIVAPLGETAMASTIPHSSHSSQTNAFPPSYKHMHPPAHRTRPVGIMRPHASPTHARAPSSSAAVAAPASAAQSLTLGVARISPVTLRPRTEPYDAHSHRRVQARNAAMEAERSYAQTLAHAQMQPQIWTEPQTQNHAQVQAQMHAQLHAQMQARAPMPPSTLEYAYPADDTAQRQTSSPYPYPYPHPHPYPYISSGVSPTDPLSLPRALPQFRRPHSATHVVAHATARNGTRQERRPSSARATYVRLAPQVHAAHTQPPSANPYQPPLMAVPPHAMRGEQPPLLHTQTQQSTHPHQHPSHRHPTSAPSVSIAPAHLTSLAPSEAALLACIRALPRLDAAGVQAVLAAAAVRAEQVSSLNTAIGRDGHVASFNSDIERVEEVMSPTGTIRPHVGEASARNGDNTTAKHDSQFTRPNSAARTIAPVSAGRITESMVESFPRPASAGANTTSVSTTGNNDLTGTPVSMSAACVGGEGNHDVGGVIVGGASAAVKVKAEEPSMSADTALPSLAAHALSSSLLSTRSGAGMGVGVGVAVGVRGMPAYSSSRAAALYDTQNMWERARAKEERARAREDKALAEKEMVYTNEEGTCAEEKSVRAHVVDTFEKAHHFEEGRTRGSSARTRNEVGMPRAEQGRTSAAEKARVHEAREGEIAREKDRENVQVKERIDAGDNPADVATGRDVAGPIIGGESGNHPVLPTQSTTRVVMRPGARTVTRHATLPLPLTAKHVSRANTAVSVSDDTPIAGAGMGARTGTRRVSVDGIAVARRTRAPAFEEAGEEAIEESGEEEHQKEGIKERELIVLPEYGSPDMFIDAVEDTAAITAGDHGGANGIVGADVGSVGNEIVASVGTANDRARDVDEDDDVFTVPIHTPTHPSSLSASHATPAPVTACLFSSLSSPVHMRAPVLPLLPISPFEPSRVATPIHTHSPTRTTTPTHAHATTVAVDAAAMGAAPASPLVSYDAPEAPHQNYPNIPDRPSGHTTASTPSYPHQLTSEAPSIGSRRASVSTSVVQDAAAAPIGAQRSPGEPDVVHDASPASTSPRSMPTMHTSGPHVSSTPPSVSHTSTIPTSGPYIASTPVGLRRPSTTPLSARLTSAAPISAHHRPSTPLGSHHGPGTPVSAHPSTGTPLGSQRSTTTSTDSNRGSSTPVSAHRGSGTPANSHRGSGTPVSSNLGSTATLLGAASGGGGSSGGVGSGGGTPLVSPNRPTRAGAALARALVLASPVAGGGRRSGSGSMTAKELLEVMAAGEEGEEEARGEERRLRLEALERREKERRERERVRREKEERAKEKRDREERERVDREEKERRQREEQSRREKEKRAEKRRREKEEREERERRENELREARARQEQEQREREEREREEKERKAKEEERKQKAREEEERRVREAEEARRREEDNARRQREEEMERQKREEEEERRRQEEEESRRQEAERRDEERRKEEEARQHAQEQQQLAMAASHSLSPQPTGQSSSLLKTKVTIIPTLVHPSAPVLPPGVTAPLCELCEDAPAAEWCEQCGQYMCVVNECAGDMHAQLRGHNRMPFYQSPDFRHLPTFNHLPAPVHIEAPMPVPAPATVSVPVSSAPPSSSSASADVSIICALCESEVAAVSCSECAMPLCPACDSDMHGPPAMATHTRTPLGHSSTTTTITTATATASNAGIGTDTHAGFANSSMVANTASSAPASTLSTSATPPSHASVPRVCDICEEGEAAVWCAECGNHLCLVNGCDEDMHAVGAMKQHVRVPC